MTRTFSFDIGQHVRFVASNLTGEIVGRYSNRDSKHSYLVRYVDAAATEVETWWTEESLCAA